MAPLSGRVQAASSCPLLCHHCRREGPHPAPQHSRPPGPLRVTQAASPSLLSRFLGAAVRFPSPNLSGGSRCSYLSPTHRPRASPEGSAQQACCGIRRRDGRDTRGGSAPPGLQPHGLRSAPPGHSSRFAPRRLPLRSGHGKAVPDLRWVSGELTGRREPGPASPAGQLRSHAHSVSEMHGPILQTQECRGDTGCVCHPRHPCPASPRLQRGPTLF